MADTSTKTTAELVSETLEDALLLVRKEMELVRTGLMEALASKLKAAGLVAGAAVLLLPGLLFILLGTALWLPFSPQVDFLVFGGVLLALAALGVMLGVRKMRGKVESSETLGRVKEDARWVRERLTR